MKTNKTEKRMIYMVKGDEITARVQGPDRMSVHQIGDYLTIGKSNTTQQNQKELSRLVNLIPKPTNIVPPITSAWSMLTNGDVDYQVQSLNTLTEALVDKEATKKAVCKKMKGTSAQKKGDIEKTKEIVGHVIAELNKTNVNKAMHGKVFEAFWKTIQTMLPGNDLLDT
ncbi:uncharacterized protein LOC127717680 isoform X1 [Mytilus californianus]|uniref:uncharacterized protein LOC127717680 isoform X1 n=1 Tax=Mytilus californianus TaxID=6549 RepID=UPI00224696A0|nr:uncharacterized protein LOC127717680 isoform X1 [Mytilus californianus]